MENNAKKHFRYAGKISHIGVEVLPNGEDITVEISHIEWKENEVINGTKKSCFVAYFKQNPYFTLPLVLNATNARMIARLANNMYINTVKDLPVILTKKMDKIPGTGIKDWCLRISETRATLQQKPIEKKKEFLTESHPKFEAVTAKLKAKQTTLEEIAKYFELTDEIKLILENYGNTEVQN